MVGHTTKPYKNTLSGSVGAGMGSIFAPGGKKYYILEHKVSSKYHRAGECQEIIVDNITLGRDSHCQVRFDESFKTVSRRHAAIVKDGDMWKLVQISQTNSTFLNGRPIKTEWYLQNGDEIQLSVNGPKLGFIIPTGKKSTVGSIGLTRRLSLFRQQALRPYKTAITVLSCILVLAVGGLATWGFTLNDRLKMQSQSLADQIILAKGNQALIDSLNKELVVANQKITDSEKKLTEIKTNLGNIKEVVVQQQKVQTENKIDITPYFKDIFVLTCKMYYEGNLVTGWGGTGFLLNNGYLVTAQHMINYDAFALKKVKDPQDPTKEIVIFDPDDESNYINAYYYAGLTKVVMEGISTAGKINIEYSYNDMPFKLGAAEVLEDKFVDESGRSWVVRAHNYRGGDWAYIKIDKTGSIEYDADYSMNLPVQTPLSIVGFPTNQGEIVNGQISPIVSQAITSRQGLEDDGTIKTSNDNSDHGNSGGPVFAVKDGKYIVVGILSGADQGADSMKGRVVPIGAIFK